MGQSLGINLPGICPRELELQVHQDRIAHARIELNKTLLDLREPLGEMSMAAIAERKQVQEILIRRRATEIEHGRAIVVNPRNAIDDIGAVNNTGGRFSIA